MSNRTRGASMELASAHRACGNALQRLGQHDEAIEHFSQALSLAPRDAAEICCDLGCSYEALGRVDEALQAYDRLRSIHSDHAQGLFNKGVLLLSRARFDGYPLLEKRFQLAGAPSHSHTAPRWHGRTVDGKLLVWAEQGLGDHIIYGGQLEELPHGDGRRRRGGAAPGFVVRAFYCRTSKSCPPGPAPTPCLRIAAQVPIPRFSLPPAKPERVSKTRSRLSCRRTAAPGPVHCGTGWLLAEVMWWGSHG